jgi:hypothetical protein
MSLVHEARAAVKWSRVIYRPGHRSDVTVRLELGLLIWLFLAQLFLFRPH